jgi:hypothetical protein
MCFSIFNKQDKSGFVTISSVDFSDGKLKSTIQDQDGFFIGTIQADLLMINSFSGGFLVSERISGPEWRPDWTKLKIGHRGSGRSTSKKKEFNASVKENTVASIRKAGTHGGADMVEFDVQLSKDNIPVVFHNFEACDLESDSPLQFPRKFIPISHLTYSQLKSGRYGHVHDKNLKEEERLFPTLRTLLETIDIKLGMNIEVKYPQDYKDGSSESSGILTHRPFFIVLICLMFIMFLPLSIYYPTKHFRCQRSDQPIRRSHLGSCPGKPSRSAGHFLLLVSPVHLCGVGTEAKRNPSFVYCLQ